MATARTSKLTTEPTPLLEVGRIGKAHGIKGESLVSLTSDRLERLDPGSVLICNDSPLTVVSSRPQQNRFIVKFAEVKDRNDAEALTGARLYAEPIDDPEALWIHELIGKKVFDQHLVDRGVVVSVIANPASDILELDTGALVPLTFVRRHAESILIEAPEGLFDME